MSPLLELDAHDASTLLEPLAVPGDGRIGAVRARSHVHGHTGDSVAWVIVEGGHGRLRVGSDHAPVDGRRDVFEGPGWSALVAPGDEFEVDGDDALATTIVWCACTRDVESRLIDPATVAEEHRGEGTTARRVRTYVSAGPLIVGETLNPPGGWSSWPPHAHAHEEIYLYRFDPSHGFGVHAAFDDDGDRPVIVRDGHIERITDGWHPEVSAPGFEMYYLWALAGDEDTLDPHLHPQFAP